MFTIICILFSAGRPHRVTSDSERTSTSDLEGCQRLGVDDSSVTARAATKPVVVFAAFRVYLRAVVMKANTVIVCTLVVFVILLQGTYSSWLTCFCQTLHTAGVPAWWSQIRLNACHACARRRSPAFICSDVAFVAHVTPGSRVSQKRIPRMQFYLKLGYNNHVGIIDVLLTETLYQRRILACYRFYHIRQSAAESGPGRIWDHHTGFV